MSSSTKCIQYTAQFPITFPNNPTELDLLAWVATEQATFKYNLLGFDFLMKYQAEINLAKRYIRLYHETANIELPFKYVRTFSRQIYQVYDDSPTPSTPTKASPMSHIPQTPVTKPLDNCIDFQPVAWDYFSEQEIEFIKQNINAETPFNPQAIHDQVLEKDQESTNDINVILDNYFKQDSNQVIDLEPV